MSDEAERAWERWAEERDEIDKRFVSYVVKDAFLAGFEAGAEPDATSELVNSNIETMRDIYGQGLQRAGDSLKSGDAQHAARVIEAALSFHPMNESWPGWPTKQEAP